MISSNRILADMSSCYNIINTIWRIYATSKNENEIECGKIQSIFNLSKRLIKDFLNLKDIKIVIFRKKNMNINEQEKKKNLPLNLYRIG